MPTKYNGYLSAADPTCGIVCECGYGIKETERELWLSDWQIVRCPKCRRGYKTEFIVWQYESDEDK